MAEIYKYNTVFLIDDNYIDNAIHDKILRFSFFAKQVISFESAVSALAYLNENSSDLTKLPQVIFLDLRMPETDGYKFLQEIEKIPGLIAGNIKIYVLSSSLDPSDRLKIEKNHLTSQFISKPLTELNLSAL